MNTRKGRPWILPGLAAALVATVLVAGCGGNGSDATPDTGEVVVGITDAAGDFVRYELDVVSLALTRANGTEVETIPLETRIDFADLTDLTEFLTAATVPSGSYVAGSLRVDYTDATIWVEGEDGEPVEARAVDGDGQPLGALDLAVHLSDRNRLVVAPGIPAHMTLDFDLAATHEVDLGAVPPQVTVDPVLVADVDLERPKPHRVRGPLVETDEDTQTFVIAIRPHWFRNPDLGRLLVSTTAETVYEVDGVSARGDAGFDLLAGKPSGTAVVAVGDLDPTSRSFRASEVYAGSSVPGGELDVFTGVVMARSGDTLTVDGATLDRDGALYLGRTVTVPLAEGTRVTRQGDPDGGHGSGEISVGQRVRVFGTYDPATDTLTPSLVRLLITRIAGTVAEVTPASGETDGELVLALQHIQGRSPNRFSFDGTGATTEDDADPLAYQTNTGPLSLASVDVADPVRVFGFVTPFGAAPPDFDAVSVADASGAVARMRVVWMEPDSGALTAGADDLVLDLTHAGPLHHVFRNGIASELSPDPAPVVAPEHPDRGVFALKRGRPTTVYTRFADFSAALQSALDDGASPTFLGALGAFDQATQAFTARRIVVRLR